MTVTLKDWSGYLAAMGRSAHTIRVRLAAVQALCEDRDLRDPTTMTRLDVINFLGRQQQPWTRWTYWSGLNAWAHFVREFGDRPDFDPMRGISRPRTPEGVARPIPDADIVRVLNARMKWRTRAYLLLGLFQGLRVHEIAKVRAEDFDLVAGWMTVLGKGGVEKQIPVHPNVLELAQQTLPHAGYWFPRSSDPSRHVSAASVSRCLSDLLHRNGVAATAHQLRDTCATRMQRQTHDLRLTQMLLRHKSVVSTQKYTAVDNEVLRTAVAELDWKAAA